MVEQKSVERIDEQGILGMKVRNSGFVPHLSPGLSFQEMAKHRAKSLIQAKRRKGRKNNQNQMIRNVENFLKMRQLHLRMLNIKQ